MKGTGRAECVFVRFDGLEVLSVKDKLMNACVVKFYLVFV